VFTTIGSLYAAVYVIAPALKPREELGATLQHISIEQHVLYADYNSRVYGPSAPLDPDYKPYALTPGVMVFVQASLKGFRSRRYGLDIRMIDKTSHSEIRPIALPKGSGRYASLLLAICDNRSPTVNQEWLTFRCWSAPPSPGTSFGIRAELYDYGDQTEQPERGSLLDFIESPAFISLKP
jgi:hypothetical protein